MTSQRRGVKFSGSNKQEYFRYDDMEPINKNTLGMMTYGANKQEYFRYDDMEPINKNTLGMMTWSQ